MRGGKEFIFFSVAFLKDMVMVILDVKILGAAPIFLFSPHHNNHFSAKEHI